MSESLFMLRALELAALGKEATSPNPMVGCVIVHNGLIIGEGFHQKNGEAHAEVNAINSVTNKSLLSESTVYVTLEPCAHFGKTPPCVDLLIAHKVKKVVVCKKDPFNQVNGKGITKLQEAGIETNVGLLSTEGEELNKYFFTSIREKRPFVILKWAETADGFVAKENGKPFNISDEYTQVLNHKWRSEVDAIMVGEQTVKNDKPSLSTRNWKGKSPKRVILDRNLTLDKSFNVFDNSVETIIYNNIENKKEGKNEWVKINFSAADFVSQILEDLNMREIRSLLVEGGPRLHQLFVANNIYDEVRIIKSKKLLKKGLHSIRIPKYLESLKTEKLVANEIFTFSR